MAPLSEVRVPDLGDFADVPVIEILVAVGDTIAVDAPLIALESDKATMEIPAPEAGVVQELLVRLGDRVSAGAPILTLARAEQDGSAAAGADGDDGADGAAPQAALADVSAPATTGAAGASVAPRGTRTPSAGDGSATPYASPSVRRLARERGVDLSALHGSGRKGRILPEDVEAAAAATAVHSTSDPRSSTRAAPLGAGDGVWSAIPPWPQVDFARFGEVERVPLSRIQKIAGPNLARNWVMIPHVTHHEEADITELEAFRRQVNAEHSEVKVTIVALLLKALVTSLRAAPDFNASLAGDELVRKHYYHLGFAADTPHGLMVPVIRDVDRKGLLEIAVELRELSERARAGKLALGDMQGGTFTVSSLGGIGGTGFTPIINAPEVAILGVTRSATRPVWDGTQFQPRLMLPLSLSYDHRVIDGAAAARFMAQLAGVLADLRRVLL